MTSEERALAIKRRDELDLAIKELYQKIDELLAEWRELKEKIDGRE